MTIIAAAEDTTGYWIASDSQGGSNGTFIELGSKLIRKYNYIIGFSYSYRVRDIILESDKFPKTIGSIKGFRKFRDILKELMLDDGCLVTAGSSETLLHPISLIVISHSGIYMMEGDYQIHKIENGYASVGSGIEVGLGALKATLATTRSAQQAVEEAVSAAILHNSTCGGNIHKDYIPKKGYK